MPYAHQSRLNGALIAGIVTGLVGLSYLSERFSNPAALVPFSLLDWLPGRGQTWWGWLFVAGGVTLTAMGLGAYIPRSIRVLVAIFGTGVWGAWGSLTAWVSLVGPDHARVGSFSAAASLGMTLCLAAVARLAIMETPRDRRHHKC